MKNCKNCGYFKNIYRRYVYRFGYSLSYPVYYCTLYEQKTESENGCGSWIRKIKEYDISPERFAEAEEDIKTLINLLC